MVIFVQPDAEEEIHYYIHRDWRAALLALVVLFVLVMVFCPDGRD